MESFSWVCRGRWRRGGGWGDGVDRNGSVDDVSHATDLSVGYAKSIVQWGSLLAAVSGETGCRAPTVKVDVPIETCELSNGSQATYRKVTAGSSHLYRYA